MVNNGRIALDDSIHSQVASISSVCNFSVFQDFDRYLNGIYRSASSSQHSHAGFGGIVAGLKMNRLVLDAMIAGAGMYEYGARIFAWESAFEHRCEVGKDATEVREKMLCSDDVGISEK